LTIAAGASWTTATNPAGQEQADWPTTGVQTKPAPDVPGKGRHICWAGAANDALDANTEKPATAAERMIPLNIRIYSKTRR
jgi:hypothetical protein